MENIAPQITRQRLLVEGYYDKSINEQDVHCFLTGLADYLALRHYAAPIIHAPSGDVKEENAGFDAFLPLIDSGISLYVWTSSKFFAVVLFTCKEFDVEKAKAFINSHLKTTKLVSQAF